MNKFKNFQLALGTLLLAATLQSCDNADDSKPYSERLAQALVTVRPSAAGGFTMQLNDSVTLYPTNMAVSPFGGKEVRALTVYRYEAATNGQNNNVSVFRLDSIRTKQPVATAGADNDKTYGNDPIEIVKDWLTVAEDGYLTLRVRTMWGHTTHYLNLLTGTNPDNPYELELRHDARGDVGGRVGDALIAFNLNSLPKGSDGKVKIKLNWTSHDGKKSAEFPLQMHSTTASATNCEASATENEGVCDRKEMSFAETLPFNARVQ